MSGLSVRGLTVSYRRPVLRSVDLDAPAGAVTGVIGPNGAGKSTLLRAVLGLVRADHGTATVDGQPAGKELRRVAYLPQRPGVDWDYPVQVREVVAMGRYPHRGLRPYRRADWAAVDDALARVGLESFARQRVGELSGGQRQRVFVARALAQEASLLLLDEPFVGVDALTVSLLCGVLRDAAGAGMTIVVVNHDLSMVPALCDHLVVLSRRVVAEGPVAAVLTDEVLGTAYGVVPPHGAPADQRFQS